MPLAEFAPHIFTVGNLRLREDPTEWSAVAQSLDVPVECVLLIRQVHGARVAIRHRHRDGCEWHPPEADAVISDDPFSAIAVRVADCAPILMVDRATGAVGAVHAGWRGAVQSAAVAGVRAMTSEFGTRAPDLVVAIGPCLGSCCGEVGEDVVQAFRGTRHGEAAVAAWFSTGPRGRPHLDLARANVDQLVAAGLRRDQIHVAGLCTKTHADLMHSYRASGAGAGRMLGVIRPIRASSTR